MRTVRLQTEKTAFAIGCHAASYALVCGVFVFLFLHILRPQQIANPGVAAYQPPPAAVVIYPESYAHAQSMTEAAQPEPPEQTIETTGRTAAERSDQTLAPPQPVLSTPPVAAAHAKKTHPVRSVKVAAPSARPSRTPATRVGAYPSFNIVY
jgi:hypothetical protein